MMKLPVSQWITQKRYFACDLFCHDSVIKRVLCNLFLSFWGTSSWFWSKPHAFMPKSQVVVF